MNANYDAASQNGAPLRCVVCDDEIPNGNWFARIKLGNGRVACCRPFCVEKFLRDRDAYARKASHEAAFHGNGD